MTAQPLSWFEAKLLGVWVSLARDTRAEGEQVAYGIRHTGPLARVAEPGTVAFSLDNSAKNSAGLVGYYSPEHPNARLGWRPGVPLRWLFDGVVRWVGWLDDDPEVVASESGPWLVRCTGIDWIGIAARTRISTSLATMVDARADEVLEAVVAAAPRPPDSVHTVPGSEAYAFAPTSSAPGAGVLRLLQDLGVSEFGQIYVRAGVLELESRLVRWNAVPQASFRAGEGFAVSTGLYNLVRVVVYPREVTSTVVLFTLQTKPRLWPGESLTFECPYVDPAQRASRIAGTDPVTPLEAGVDYTANEQEDGSGADRTASLSVTCAFGFDKAKVTLENTHASAVIYATAVQGRGRGLYTYEPLTVEQRDQDSIDTYDEREIRVELPYQSSPTIAAGLASAILREWREPTSRSARWRFCCDPRYDQQLFEAARDLDISSCISIRSEVLGLERAYWINGVEFDVDAAGIPWCTWHLTRADTARYWHLGTPGFSEVPATTLPVPL